MSRSARELLDACAPKRAEALVRRLVYWRNCRLDPTSYRRELARWYRLTTGEALRLDDPRTLREKIQWLKLCDSTPEKGRWADKHLMRALVAERLGPGRTVPELGVWDDPDDIDFSALPASFVLKATHGSRMNVVVRDRDVADEGAVRRALRRHLRTRLAMTGGFELHYEFCEPRVIAEPLLRDDSGGLRDYKAVVIGGRVQFFLAVEGRYGDMHSCACDVDWRPMPFSYGHRVGDVRPIPRPAGLALMVREAEALAAGFAFVRVDFFEAAGRVYVGELTFTPANGLSCFAPAEYGRAYGDMLELPQAKPFRGVML